MSPVFSWTIRTWDLKSTCTKDEKFGLIKYRLELLLYLLIYVFYHKKVKTFSAIKVEHLAGVKNLTIERTYICETSSFGRKVSRRKAVLLLVFSLSVADYEETKGFWQNFFYIKMIMKALGTFWTILKACRPFFNDLWP